MNGSNREDGGWFDAPSPTGRRDRDRSGREHVELIRMYEVFDKDHDRLRRELMAALPAETPRRAATPTPAWPSLGGFLMNQVLTRKGALLLAPAACVVLGAVAFFTWSEGPAFAQIVDRLRAVESIICRVRTSTTGSVRSQSEGTLYFSARHGVRYEIQTESTSQFIFYRPSDGPPVVVNPESKTRITVSSAAEQPPDPAHASPDEWLRRLLRITDEPSRKLGRQKIDGVIADGFEITGAELGPGGLTDTETACPTSAQVWVEVATGMPIRYVVQASRPELDAEMTIVHDQFRWNEVHDASFFHPSLGEDQFDVSIRIPPSNEEALMGALRLYAQAFGEYPTALESAILASRLMAALVVKSGVARSPQDPEFKRIAQEVLVIPAGCEFYNKLKREGRQPEYFGIDVKPGEAQTILIRWRLDDGRSQVVYGDLKTETRN